MVADVDAVSLGVVVAYDYYACICSCWVRCLPLGGLAVTSGVFGGAGPLEMFVGIQVLYVPQDAGVETQVSWCIGWLLSCLRLLLRTDTQCSRLRMSHGCRRIVVADD